MDIDGVDLEDVGGFASIDNDASDEPTQILMIHGLQEQLLASDIGRALHAHFDPTMKAAGTSNADAGPKPWLSKVITLHSITGGGDEQASQSITNVGKAFAVCSDVGVATGILDAFEEQYLESEVEEGFRLKLPEDVTQRLIDEVGMTPEQAATTDQLLICYATPAVFQQCALDDKRDARSTIPVRTDWGELRFSYRDLSHGVQSWDASELFPSALPAPPTPEKPQLEASDGLLSADGPSKKRSRSAMIREELRQQQQQQESPKLSLKEEGLKLAAAIHQAKIDFLHEQIAHGVQVWVPPELQRTFPNNTTPDATNQPQASRSLLSIHVGTPVTPSGIRLSTTLPSRPLQSLMTPASLPRPPVPSNTPADKFTSPMSQLPKAPQNTPFGAHVVPQSQPEPVKTSASSTANGRNNDGGFSSPVSPEAVNSQIDLPASIPSQAASKRRRGFSDHPDPEPRQANAVKVEDPLVKQEEGDEDALLTGSSMKSRWDIKNGKENAPHDQSSSRRASGRHRIPGPAQAPPVLVSPAGGPPSGEGRGNAPSGSRSTSVTTTLVAAPDTLEVPSGLRLPAPMEGLTRRIGRDDEVPLDYDFCNEDRLLCLLCMRVFKSSMTMKKHVWESSLHKKNVEDPDMRRKGVLQLYSSFTPRKEADTAETAAPGQLSTQDPATSAAVPSGTPVEAADQVDSTPNVNAVASPVSPTYRDRAMERRAVYRGE
ncbi:hypothetical protein OC846_005951 [Tilletia horrida]|uniref:Uncharacterized protein n=1 Tax=Tilletia horrida TaxID=155126 RepID=A0AAN6GM33_9BASI|nr:hypothetical protein OC846_005951 [Tilletia horrida]